MCYALWENHEVSWEMIPSINRARGVLCLWCKEDFHLNNSFIIESFLALEGVLKGQGREVTMFN